VTDHARGRLESTPPTHPSFAAVSHRHHPLRAIALLATPALAFAAACGESTGPQANVDVTFGVTGIIGPNINQAPAEGNRVACDVGLFAVARGNGKATWGDATFRWYGGKDRSVAFDSAVVPATEVNRAWGGSSIDAGTRLTTSWTLWANIPFSAAVELHYRVANGTEKIVTTKFDCGPPVTSTVGLAELSNISAVSPSEILEPGGVLLVEYTAASQAGVWRTAVLVSGPCEVYQEFDERLETSLTKTAVMAIPADCELGTAVDVTVYVTDATLARRARQISTPYRLADKTKPTIRGTTIARPSGPYFVGESIDFSVTPNDNHSVKSVVWEVKPFGVRDSVESPARGSEVKVRIPVRDGWSGPIELRYFVHDATGLTSDTLVAAASSVAVYPTVQRPVASFAMGDFDDASEDEVIDVKRNVAYLMQQRRRRIAVLSLATMEVESTIPLAIGPSDMDLTIGGDSLLVVSTELAAVGVIDLTRADRRLELVPLEPVPIGFPSTSVRNVSEVVALSNGKAFVVGHVDFGTRWLIEIDLRTGAQRYRGEAGPGSIGGTQLEGALLARSHDASVMLVRSLDCLQRYDAASDQVSPCVRGTTLAAINSVDGTGQRISIGPDIYDAAWRHLRRIEMLPAGAGGSSALTIDGQELFLPFGAGVVRSNAVDGRILDHQVPPIIPKRVHATPDGKSMLVVGTSTATGYPAIALIDLR
jgi:hypothetical protein